MGQRGAEKRSFDDRTAMKLGAAQIESRKVDAFEIAVGKMKRLMVAGFGARMVRRGQALHVCARQGGIAHRVASRIRRPRR
jgi:hypothetical protein